MQTFTHPLFTNWFLCFFTWLDNTVAVTTVYCKIFFNDLLWLCKHPNTSLFAGLQWILNWETMKNMRCHCQNLLIIENWLHSLWLRVTDWQKSISWSINPLNINDHMPCCYYCKTLIYWWHFTMDAMLFMSITRMKNKK